MRRVGLLALCALLLTQSASWSLEPAFYRLDLHFQVPLEKQFKRLISGKGRKDPAIAILLATVPPFVAIQGLGQVYNSEIGKGLMFFGLGQLSFSTWFSAFDETTANVALAIYMGSWIYSTIDAYRSAKRINRQRGYAEVRPLLTPRPRPIPAYTWRRLP
jgi:TM2 domain-containing membrane protein YozV